LESYHTDAYVSGSGMGLEFHSYINTRENMKEFGAINTWKLDVTHQ